MLNDGIHKAIISEELWNQDEYYDKKYEDMQVRLDKLYDEIEEIDTFIEAEQEDGRILRSLKFRFSVFFNEQENGT